MNKNITKKIVAIVTSLTVFVWLAGPGIAQATTLAELEALIAELTQKLADAQTQLTALQAAPTGVPAGFTFTKNLRQGMTDPDVVNLKIILAAEGCVSGLSNTELFGAKTTEGTKCFCKKYKDAISEAAGYTVSCSGLVGAGMRAKLNTLTGGLPSGCECTSWVTGACASGANAGKKVQTRTCTPAACAIETQYVTDATCAAGGENKVSLAADTPAAASVAQGALNVIFAKINFCAASAANTVSKIVLKRGGIAADADLSAVKLYEGSTQIGSTQALNTTYHTATFSSLNWTIPANECKVLTVKASIAATGATTGDTVKLSIESASDITATVALDGVFPISSNGMTLAGISAGTLEISTTTPSGGTAIAGGVDLDISGFTFTASATEAVNVHTVILTQAGSAVPSDITNIKLFYGSTQLGSTVAALTSSGKATIDMSSSP